MTDTEQLAETASRYYVLARLAEAYIHGRVTLAVAAREGGMPTARNAAEYAVNVLRSMDEALRGPRHSTEPGEGR